MLLCTTDFDPEQEERYLRLLRAKHVDGALVDGLVLPPERIARFVEDGFPIVCLDRDVNSPAVPLVQVDNRMGARMATEHLLALGHRRIAHIMGAPARISEERLLGYQGALEAAGVSPTRRSSRSAPSPRRAATTRCARCSRPPRPDGGVRGQRPLGDRRAERDRRERPHVPGDVSMVGFDDLRLARYTAPPLTTIRQPAGEIARHSTELLLGMIAGSRRESRHLFVPELIIRSSTSRRADARPAACLDGESVSAYCKRLPMAPCWQTWVSRSSPRCHRRGADRRLSRTHAARAERHGRRHGVRGRRRAGEPLAPEFGVATAPTPEDLIASGVDAIVIATPTPTHAPLIRLAARRRPARLLREAGGPRPGRDRRPHRRCRARRHARADRLPAPLRRRLPRGPRGGHRRLARPAARRAARDPRSRTAARGLHRRLGRDLPRPPHPRLRRPALRHGRGDRRGLCRRCRARDARGSPITTMSTSRSPCSG